MIRYALVCDKKHAFEIWFGSSADYERQRKRKLVTCPACGSSRVEKAIMAPAVSRGKKQAAAQVPQVSNDPAPAPTTEPATEPVAMISPQEQEVRARLKELRAQLIKNADNVGKKFPEEARKIHYGEIEHRSIYGEASPEDAKALHEEGIEFHPLPVLPDERN
jgi:hypothetical protein